MTKTTEYQCNLCHAKYDISRLRGIYFVGSTGLEFKHPRDTENHICEFCIKGVCKMAEEEAGYTERAIAP